jgi:membrane protein required for colicin V production
MDLLPLVDWLILAVILVSTLISLIRGFVKEALSLATLVISVVVARLFGQQVSSLLVDYISVPSIRLMVAYSALFIATMSVGGMINHLISHVVEMTGLSGTDRLLGMIFGLARGGLITIVAVALLSQMPVTEDAWWQDSELIPHFAVVADLLQEWIFSSAGRVVQKT